MNYKALAVRLSFVVVFVLSFRLLLLLYFVFAFVCLFLRFPFFFHFKAYLHTGEVPVCIVGAETKTTDMYPLKELSVYWSC